MPATGTRKKNAAFVLGVDGCPKGWLAVRLFPHRGVPQSVEQTIFSNFNDLLRSEWGQAELVLIDMPIGLADHGRRGCDTLARRKLGKGRAASVFPAPRRPMLEFATYEAANAWGKAQGKDAGGGLSKQAWNILPKIRELDACLTPDLQEVVREAHPEVAFLRLNDGSPVVAPKRKLAGQQQRARLLEANGLMNLNRTWQQLAAEHRRQAAKLDDYYDACALALTASSICLDQPVLHLTENLTDQRGLKMEIWG
ncbi:DUF429 domain-containing protein [Parvularcula sp. IMCC14364]|uniref:DUF429 domain-containing protein n=1 Tax=Parvularcula sp. IMCC14364 TaxID=3067902 RepID=UPI002740F230|nr:DUF429 domain-containing protein [Parvularcula sp. IMCC14364]